MFKHSVILFLASVASAPSSQAAEVQDLRCEYRQDPLGIDVAKPRLSWKITLRPARRSANGLPGARRVVAEALMRDQADCWDSGKVASDNPSWSSTPAGR